jgi:hypothetical protein
VPDSAPPGASEENSEIEAAKESVDQKMEAALKINEWVMERYKWSKIYEGIHKLISEREAVKDSWHERYMNGWWKNGKR